MESRDRTHIIAAIQFPIYLIVVLWLIHIFKLMFGLSIRGMGNLPRDMDGLLGIFTSPFIHGSFQHLISNTVPLFVLTFLILSFYHRIAYQSMMLIYILTGVAVWSFGRGYVYHIGASGVVYGLVAFVFWMGLFRRDMKSIVLALIVTVLYSGFVFGILPLQSGISWESHLFGGLVGILVAFWYRKSEDDRGEPEDVAWDDESEERRNLFPPDLFEKTREERLRENQTGGHWTSDSTY